MNKKAICILSGGMDSTLASYLAKKDGYEIIAVHFNYGQRTQNRELKAFRDICADLGILEKYEIDIPFFTQIGASALTDMNIDVPTGGIEAGVPITYVPFRNGIFLSITAAIAEKEGASAMYIGVVQVEHLILQLLARFVLLINEQVELKFLYLSLLLFLDL
jgi:7-cyano-7-deazaguanine synthase